MPRANVRTSDAFDTYKRRKGDCASACFMGSIPPCPLRGCLGPPPVHPGAGPVRHKLHKIFEPLVRARASGSQQREGEKAPSRGTTGSCAPLEGEKVLAGAEPGRWGSLFGFGQESTNPNKLQARGDRSHRITLVKSGNARF